MTFTVEEVLAGINPTYTMDELSDKRLSRSKSKIGEEVISLLSLINPKSDFNNAFLSATCANHIIYHGPTNFLRLGDDFHESFYLSGVMEQLYKYNTPVNKVIFQPEESLLFKTYCLDLTDHIIWGITEQKGLGSELIRPLDRHFYRVGFSSPFTAILGIGLYMARQGLIKKELTSPNASSESYVGLESTLRKV